MAKTSKDVRELTANTAIKMEQLEGKLVATHRLVTQMVSLLGDVETRLETLKTLGINGNAFTEAEWEATWDDIKGLRVKDGTEAIAHGDIVRIGFEAVDKETGDPAMAAESLALRIGSGAMLFEGQFVGKPAGESEFEFDQQYPKVYPPNPQFSGKTLAFKVKIAKVKCKRGDSHAN